MSHMKRALDIVQDLRKLADSIEALVDSVYDSSADAGVSPTESPAVSAATMPPKTAAKPTVANVDIPTATTDASTTATPKLTIVELRAFVSERSTPENRPRIKAILTRYGVAKLTELPEEKYGDIMREVAAL